MHKIKASGNKKTYTSREFEILLKQNGYIYERSKGDHNIYTKDGRHISFPATKMNRMVARRLIKEYNLIRM